MSGSPQSTLSGIGSWSNNGSPTGPSSQVPSPPTTPFGAQNDTWDLIYAAAGQVARLKMNSVDGAVKFSNSNGRGLLGPPRSPSPSFPCVQNQSPFTQVRTIWKISSLKKEGIFSIWRWTNLGFWFCSFSKWDRNKCYSHSALLPGENQWSLTGQLSSNRSKTEEETLLGVVGICLNLKMHGPLFKVNNTRIAIPDPFYLMGPMSRGSPPAPVFSCLADTPIPFLLLSRLAKEQVTIDLVGSGYCSILGLIEFVWRVSNFWWIGCPTVLLPAKVVQALNLSFEDMNGHHHVQQRFNNVALAPNHGNA